MTSSKIDPSPRPAGRGRLALIIFLLFGCAILAAACGGPKVASTSIDGRVQQIDNWAIECVGDSTVTLDSIALRWLTEKRSKYTEPEFCLEYIAEVRSRLVTAHDIPFYDNLPPNGRMEITLTPGKRTWFSSTYGTDAERVIDDVAKERSGILADPFDRDRTYQYHVELVRSVNVRLFDREGTLLGEILLGGDDSKVKPEHVAEAIANAIKQGRVKVATPTE